MRDEIKYVGEYTTEAQIKLMTTVAEQAISDYKSLCIWLISGRRWGKMQILDKLNAYFCLREYFDSGLNGLIMTGKFSLSSQIDKRLMNKGIDADRAHYNANRMLSSMNEDVVRQWIAQDNTKLRKEGRLYGRNRSNEG